MTKILIDEATVKLVLSALEAKDGRGSSIREAKERAINALREALEKQPAPATELREQEPTKAMIDAAERIDWSDSNVRGNIANMWQAMCAVAPQPAQQTCNCRWEGEVQVQECTLHESHLLAIHEWAGRAKAAEAKLKEKNT